MDVTNFLQQLPAAAGSPLALGAYALALAAWITVVYLRHKPQRGAPRVPEQFGLETGQPSRAVEYVHQSYWGNHLQATIRYKCMAHLTAMATRRL